MHTGIVIPARMSSARLPGKALRPLGDRALLDHVIDRARRVTSARSIVVATSSDPMDDAIARHCRSHHVGVFRGCLDDVARRVLDCAIFWEMDLVARVNGDSPFLDPDLINAGIRRAIKDRLDFVTNIHPRSFPYGVAVEVFRTELLADEYARMERREDREHVTASFYRRLSSLRCVNMRMEGEPASDINLTVDEESDLRRAEALLSRLGDDPTEASLGEIIAAYREMQRAGEIAPSGEDRFAPVPATTWQSSPATGLGGDASVKEAAARTPVPEPMRS